MKLTNTGLQNRSEWEEKGYVLPSFDRTSMIQKTKEHPTWVHFGAGNIFRIFPAALQQRLLSEGLGETGIIVGEGFDYQIIDEVYEKHDNLTLMVTLKSDGTIGKEVIASVAAAYKCDQQFSSEWEFFKKTFRSPFPCRWQALPSQRKGMHSSAVMDRSTLPSKRTCRLDLHRISCSFRGSRH